MIGMALLLGGFVLAILITKPLSLAKNQRRKIGVHYERTKAFQRTSAFRLAPQLRALTLRSVILPGENLFWPYERFISRRRAGAATESTAGKTIDCFIHFLPSVAHDQFHTFDNIGGLDNHLLRQCG